MGAHSFLPPSGAAAWRVCAMWPTMNQLYGQGGTQESREGTAAHWAFAELLEGRPICDGLVAPNDVVLTEEMIEGAELVREVVEARIPKRGMMHRLHIESRVSIPEVHELCFGTPDIWGFDQETMTLEVIDYKYGHKFVDEYDNYQGVAYVCGIIDVLAQHFGVAVSLLDQGLRVNFTVIQPRCFYRGNAVRTWSFMASDIRAHVNQLKAAALEALEVSPKSTTNEECCHCPGRHACQALQKAAYRDAEISTQTLPDELTPDAASLELKFLQRALDRLQSRCDGLTETVTAFARSGKVTPWHSVEQGYGRQVWTVSPEQVAALGDLYSVQLRKTAVVTPKQAAKIGIDESVISAYSVTPTGKIKLIPANPADAARVFGSTFKKV